MLRLVLAFVEIALHRRGPESLPPSTFLLGAVAALDVVLAVAIRRLDTTPRSLVVPLAAVDLVLGTLFIWSLLRAFGRERRFKQTIIALFGVDVLLGALVLPLALAVVAIRNGGGDPGVVQIVWFAIVIWSLDISAFVLSRAIERPYIVTIALVIGFLLLMLALESSILPLAAR